MSPYEQEVSMTERGKPDDPGKDKPEHPHGTPPGQTEEHDPPGQQKPRPDQDLPEGETGDPEQLPA